MNEKHKWKSIPVPERLTQDFYSAWICTRGDCKCIRLAFYYKGTGRTGYMYDRNMQIHNIAPECWGDTPLNKQTID